MKKFITLFTLILLSITNSIFSYTIDYLDWKKNLSKVKEKVYFYTEENFLSPTIYGDRIYFVNKKNDIYKSIYKLNFNGGIPSVLIDEPYANYSISTALYSNRFVYISNKNDSRGDLYYGFLSNSGKLLYSSSIDSSLAQQCNPKISNNGKWVFYISGIKRKLLRYSFNNKSTDILDSNIVDYGISDSTILFVKKSGENSSLYIKKKGFKKSKLLLKKSEILSPILVDSFVGFKSRDTLYLLNIKSLELKKLNYHVFGELYYYKFDKRIYFFTLLNSKRALISIDPYYNSSLIKAKNSRYQYWYALDLLNNREVNFQNKIDAFLVSLSFFKKDRYTINSLQMAINLFYENRNSNITQFNDFILKLKKSYPNYLNEIDNFNNYYSVINGKSVDTTQQVKYLLNLKNGYLDDLKDFRYVRESFVNPIVDKLEYNCIKKNYLYYWQFNIGKNYFVDFLKNSENSSRKDSVYNILENFSENYINEIRNKIDVYDINNRLKIVLFKKKFVENGDIQDISYYLNLINSVKLKNQFLESVNSQILKKIKDGNDILNYLSSIKGIKLNKSNSYFLYSLILKNKNRLELKRDKLIINLKNILYFNNKNRVIYQIYILCGGNDYATDNKILNQYLDAYYYYNLSKKDNSYLEQSYKSINSYLSNKIVDDDASFLKAKILYQLGKKDLNKDYFLSAIKIIKQLKNNSTDSLVWLFNLELSKLYEELDKNHNAINYLKDVVLENRNFDKLELAGYYYKLSQLYVKISQKDSAIASLKRAENIFFSVDRTKYLPIIYRMYVYIYQVFEDYENANEYLDKLVSRKIDKNSYKDFSNLAVNYGFTEDYDLSFKNSILAEKRLYIPFDFQFRDRIKVGVVYPFIPTVKFSEVGKARYRFSKYDEKALLSSLKWNYYVYSGRVFEGYDDLIEKLDIAIREKDKLMEAIVYNNLAYYSFKNQDSVGVLFNIKKSLEICVKYYRDDKELESGLINNLELFNGCKYSFNNEIYDLIKYVDATKLSSENRQKFNLYKSLFLLYKREFLSSLTAVGELYQLQKDYNRGEFWYKSLSLFLVAKYTKRESDINNLLEYNSQIYRLGWNDYSKIVFNIGDFYANFNNFYESLVNYEKVPPFFNLSKLNVYVNHFILSNQDRKKRVEVYEKFRQLSSYFRLKDINLSFKSEFDKNYYNMFKNFYRENIYSYKDSISIFYNDSIKLKRFIKKYKYYINDMKSYIQKEVKSRDNYYMLKLPEIDIDSLLNRVNSANVCYFIGGKKIIINNIKNGVKKDTVFIGDRGLNKISAITLVDYILLNKNINITKDTNLVYNDSLKLINAKSIIIYNPISMLKRVEFGRVGSNWLVDIFDRIINVDYINFYNINLDAENISILSKLISLAGCRGFYINSRFFGVKGSVLKKYHKKELIEYFKLAKIYKKRKEYKLALKKVLQAKNIAIGNFDKKYGYYIDLLLAELYSKNGLDKNAILVLKSRLGKIGSKNRKDFEKFFIVLSLLNKYLVKNREFKESERVLKDAIEVSKSFGDLDKTAIIQYQLGNSLIYLNRFEDGISYMVRSARYYKKSGEIEKNYMINKKIANIYMDKVGLLQDAQKLYLSMLQDSIPNKLRLTLFYEMSGLYIKWGKIKKAKFYLDKAEKLIENRDNSDMFNLYKIQWKLFSGNINGVDTVFNKFSTDKYNIFIINFKIINALFKRDIQTADSLNNYYYQMLKQPKYSDKYSSYLTNLGWIMYLKGNKKEAESAFLEALNIDKSGESKRDLIVTYRNIFAYYYFTNNKKSIKKLYKDFKERFPKRVFDNYYDMIEYYVGVVLQDYKKLNVLYSITDNRDLVWRIELNLIDNPYRKLSLNGITKMLTNDYWTHLKWNWYYKNNYSVFYQKLLSSADSLQSVYINYKKIRLSQFYVDYDSISNNLEHFDSLNCIIYINNKKRILFKNKNSWSVVNKIIGKRVVPDRFSDINNKKYNYIFPFNANIDCKSSVNSQYYNYVKFYTEKSFSIWSINSINDNIYRYGSVKDKIFIINNSRYREHYLWQKVALVAKKQLYVYSGHNYMGYYNAKIVAKRGEDIPKVFQIFKQ